MLFQEYGEQIRVNYLTHLQPMFHFYTPFLCFQGVQKWNIGWEWVNNWIGNFFS